MIDTRSSFPTRDRTPVRVGMVSTFPPTRCGIGKYSFSLVKALEKVDPEIAVDIVRLVPDGPGRANRESVLEVVPGLPLSMRSAARRLNRCDVVVIQHEFGIFGPADGESVIDLVGMINVPVISVLHTVPAQLSHNQGRILDALAAQSRLATLSEGARTGLARHRIAPIDDVGVIKHGAGWGPAPHSSPRHSLVTWGLLGPGKGLERAIAALPLLRDLDPMPTYRIIGRTHPNVARSQGFAYRESLESLVSDLGVEDMVEFVDRFLAENELQGMVHRSGIVVIPYDNKEQISSGVLTEAIAAGRPVVATRFPYSEEMLSGGAGIVVDHDNRAVAAAIRRLLTSPDLYQSCVEAAQRLATQHSWPAVARHYSRFIRETASPLYVAGSLKA